jgi:hypothetical protein
MQGMKLQPLLLACFAHSLCTCQVGCQLNITVHIPLSVANLECIIDALQLVSPNDPQVAKLKQSLPAGNKTQIVDFGGLKAVLNNKEHKKLIQTLDLPVTLKLR